MRMAAVDNNIRKSGSGGRDDSRITCVAICIYIYTYSTTDAYGYDDVCYMFGSGDDASSSSSHMRQQFKLFMCNYL